MALVQQFDWLFHIVLIILALMLILCLTNCLMTFSTGKNWDAEAETNR